MYHNNHIKTLLLLLKLKMSNFVQKPASDTTPLLATPRAPTTTSASNASASNASAATTTSASTATVAAAKPVFRFPHEKTMMHAVKLSISEDKPIMMDYWVPSLQKKALIGVREENNERMLVKSEDEYTSPIAKLFNVETDFIVMTENSIYLVDSQITRSKIA